jgi:hypothetical protein
MIKRIVSKLTNIHFVELRVRKIGAVCGSRSRIKVYCCSYMHPGGT